MIRPPLRQCAVIFVCILVVGMAGCTGMSGGENPADDENGLTANNSTPADTEDSDTSTVPAGDDAGETGDSDRSAPSDDDEPADADDSAPSDDDTDDSSSDDESDTDDGDARTGNDTDDNGDDADADETHTLTVTVVDDRTGDPLSDAGVELNGNATVIDVDDNGTVSFEVEAGTHTVYGFASGYHMGDVQGISVDDDTDVTLQMARMLTETDTR